MNSYSNEKRIRGKKILVLAMSLMLIMVMIPASAFASGSASDLTGFGTCVQSITLSGAGRSDSNHIGASGRGGELSLQKNHADSSDNHKGRCKNLLE